MRQAVPDRESNPGNSGRASIWAIFAKFAANSASGIFGCPKWAVSPCHGTSNQKVVPHNFRNHFYRAKILPRFGFVPSNPPKGPKKYPNIKKGPKGGSVALGPPQSSPIKRWCESHVLANGRTNPSIDPQYPRERALSTTGAPVLIGAELKYINRWD